MKRVPTKSSVMLEQPSSERRRELKKNPHLADTLDEEVWLTRSRLSALNGVQNSILTIDGVTKTLKSTAANLCWGLFGTQLNKDTERGLAINRKNIDSSEVLSRFLDAIPSQDFHKIEHHEDTGLYWGFAMRNGKLVAGLPRLKKAEAYVSLLAVFAIRGLNEKLAAQLQHVTQEQSGPLSDRVHMLAKMAGKVPFEDLED